MLGFVLVPKNITAIDFSKEENLRESCRKIVAGRYLSLFDARKKYQDFSDYLQQKLKKVSIKLKQAEELWQQSKIKAQADIFDIATIENEERKRSAYLAIKEAHSMAEKALIELKQKLTVSIDQHAAFKKKISKVFDFVPIKGDGLSYKFIVSYKQACPKYNTVCPLARKYAISLKKIFPTGEIPLSCERYATYLRF